MVSNSLDKSMNIAPVALPPSASFRIRSVKKSTANCVEAIAAKTRLMFRPKSGEFEIFHELFVHHYL